VIDALALTPLHVTVTVPVPGCVAVPIFQDQLTTPATSAVFGVRPCAELVVPCGVTYEMEHEALGDV
jgi:hypothetical protein